MQKISLNNNRCCKRHDRPNHPRQKKNYVDPGDNGMNVQWWMNNKQQDLLTTEFVNVK